MGEFVIKGQDTTPEGMSAPQQPKKKKKNGMPGIAKFFIILLSVLVGIPVILVGALYGCFYDGVHTEVPVRENYPTETVFNDVLVDAFDLTTSEQHILQLGLKTENMNQVLYNALSKKPEVKEYIKNLYVDVSTGTMTMVLEAGAFNIFKTRAFLTCSIEESLDADAIIFHITDVRLGRIGGLQKALDFVKNFVQLPDLSKMLADVGFHITVDLNNLTMTYKLIDFYQDLTKLMGTGSGDFLSIIQELLLNKDLRSFEAPHDKTIFAYDLLIDNIRTTKATHGIDGYIIPDGYFAEPLEEVRTILESLLDDEKILEKDTDLVAKYLMGGVDLLQGMDEFAIINDYENDGVFTPYSANIPYYKGYRLPEEFELKSIIEKQIKTTIPSGSYFDITVTTEQLDKMLSAATSNGIMATFKRNVNLGTTEPNDYKVNFTCSDRITTLVKDNNLYIVINVNLNGYAANMALKTSKNPGDEFGKVSFVEKDMYLGDTEVLETTKSNFMKIINNALEGDMFNGIIGTNDGNLIINIASVLTGKSIDPSYFDTEFILTDSTATTPGALTIRVSKK